MLTKLDQDVKGSGFWKLNVSLLEDEVTMQQQNYTKTTLVL